MPRNLASLRYFLPIPAYNPASYIIPLQPSLMNFCVTDGESIVVTRYISSRVDEAASLVCSSTSLDPSSNNYLF